MAIQRLPVRRIATVSLDDRGVGRRTARRVVTAETAHHPSGPLVLALSPAAVAGFIDAHLFLHVTNVFVANMSGNLVRVGIFSGTGDWSIAVGSLGALLAFAAGVVVAIAHHVRRLQQYKPVRPDELLAIEALLVLSLPACC